MRRMMAAGPPAKRPPHIGFGAAAAGSLWGAWVRRSTWFGTVALVLLMALSPFAAGEDNSDNNGIQPGQFIPVNPPQPEPQTAVADLAGRRDAPPVSRPVRPAVRPLPARR